MSSAINNVGLIHTPSGWSFKLMTLIFKYQSHFVTKAIDREQLFNNLKEYAERQELYAQDGVSIFHTGSEAEGLYLPMAAPTERRKSDVDILVEIGEVNDANSALKHSPNIYTMKTAEPDYPGYVYLYNNDGEMVKPKEYMKSAKEHKNIGYIENKMNLEFELVQGPSLQHRFDLHQDTYDVQGNRIKAGRCIEFEVDIVPALRCINPPKKVIDNFLSKSCDWAKKAMGNIDLRKSYYLVAKPHPEDTLSESTFRLSFSGIEIALALSFTEAQRTSYVATKRLLKELFPSPRDESSTRVLMRTYFIKNCMFYVCDKYERNTWTFSNIGDRVMEMLDWLTHCYECGILPNYIIPERNMISHLSKRERDTVCHKLHYLQKNWLDVWKPCIAKVIRLLPDEALNLLVDNKSAAAEKVDELSLKVLEECEQALPNIASRLITGFMLQYDIVRCYWSRITISDAQIYNILSPLATDISDIVDCDLTDDNMLSLHNFISKGNGKEHVSIPANIIQNFAGYMNTNICQIRSSCGELGFPNYLFLYSCVCEMLPVTNYAQDYARYVKALLLFNRSSRSNMDDLVRDDLRNACQEYFSEQCRLPLSSALVLVSTTDCQFLTEKYFSYACIAHSLNHHSTAKRILESLLSVEIDDSRNSYPKDGALWITLYTSELASHDEYIRSLLKASRNRNNYTSTVKDSVNERWLGFFHGFMRCELKPIVYFYLIKVLYESGDIHGAGSALTAFSSDCESQRGGGPRYTIFDTNAMLIDWSWYLLAYSNVRCGHMDRAEVAFQLGHHKVYAGQIHEEIMRARGKPLSST